MVKITRRTTMIKTYYKGDNSILAESLNCIFVEDIWTNHIELRKTQKAEKGLKIHVINHVLTVKEAIKMKSCLLFDYN